MSATLHATVGSAPGWHAALIAPGCAVDVVAARAGLRDLAITGTGVVFVTIVGDSHGDKTRRTLRLALDVAYPESTAEFGPFALRGAFTIAERWNNPIEAERTWRDARAPTDL